MLVPGTKDKRRCFGSIANPRAIGPRLAQCLRAFAWSRLWAADASGSRGTRTVSGDGARHSAKTRVRIDSRGGPRTGIACSQATGPLAVDLAATALARAESASRGPRAIGGQPATGRRVKRCQFGYLTTYVDGRGLVARGEKFESIGRPGHRPRKSPRSLGLSVRLVFFLVGRVYTH